MSNDFDGVMDSKISEIVPRYYYYLKFVEVSTSKVVEDIGALNYIEEISTLLDFWYPNYLLIDYRLHKVETKVADYHKLITCINKSRNLMAANRKERHDLKNWYDAMGKDLDRVNKAIGKDQSND